MVVCGQLHARVGHRQPNPLAVFRPTHAAPNTKRSSPNNSRTNPYCLCSASQRSYDKHGVAEAEEAIALALGLLVSLKEDAAARVNVLWMRLGDEGADQHEQAGAGQVEVGDQYIHGAEAVSGPDEQVYRAGEGGCALPGASLSVIGIDALCACGTPFKGAH